MASRNINTKSNAVRGLVYALKYDVEVDLKMLLDEGDIQTDTYIGGSTPLHIAAENGSWQCVLVLIENEADVFALNDHGKTPAQVCKNHADYSETRCDNSCDHCHRCCFEELSDAMFRQENHTEYANS
jgi:hypothetical protein